MEVAGGSVALQSIPTLDKTSFELSGESGIYFLEYVNGSEVYRIKLIKR